MNYPTIFTMTKKNGEAKSVCVIGEKEPGVYLLESDGKTEVTITAKSLEKYTENAEATAAYLKAKEEADKAANDKPATVWVATTDGTIQEVPADNVPEGAIVLKDYTAPVKRARKASAAAAEKAAQQAEKEEAWIARLMEHGFTPVQYEKVPHVVRAKDTDGHLAFHSVVQRKGLSVSLKADKVPAGEKVTTIKFQFPAMVFIPYDAPDYEARTEAILEACQAKAE